ncbi:nitroreductase family protein [Moorena producens JHB]|uniref:Nitroreductase family protein n=1 Tax=Moorena producens (strain JHB) TaxID=1454205 RepID=A0A1D9FUW0_MOOP1|nr:nitroreductase family protein [Moorena producens]AOY79093.1 nitroreductase family protein [Moorena producens JHB]
MYLLPSVNINYLNIRNTLRSIRKLFDLFKNYYYDFRRFSQKSALLDEYSTKIRHQGRIIAHYHVIEKGLSLKTPRTGFGTDVVNNLLSILNSYHKQYGLDEIGQVALNTLFSYYQFNLSRGQDNQELLNELNYLKSTIPQKVICITEGGVKHVVKEDIVKPANFNFREFVNSRHSIRNFASGTVPINLIEDAVSMALRTPSVCNRQTWKVHLFSDAEIKKKVLSHQNGNRGFGDTADKILIVTSDLNYFTVPGERNQGFIDGGMFAMSLIHALHSLGIGTCCLNWSVTYKVDQALHRNAGISDSEIIIMMIAIGQLPEQFCVAQSSRRKVQDILITH